VGSDIARVSFDPTRQYRSVVAQQGRVTLEADVNEASRIASEALRLETIDLIGPVASPDGGYNLGLDASGNVAVMPGTIYLGGWRLRLDQPVELDNQPDWLNMPPQQNFGGPAVVSLLATEQSVSAVEDQPLREVALGGPDTAARTRLMQHFLHLPSRGDTCDIAAGAVAAILGADGVTLDPKTLQLLYSARLQVGFVPPTRPPDPCEPPAQGGYLGADNQMVRVTVIEFNPQSGKGTLLWGWNNASFLYRGTPSGPQALSLTPVPIDAEHAPQQNQAVEVLLTQADLGDGNEIASFSGQVAVLTQAYDFDTNLMTLPAGFTLPNTNRPLFVRLWQATAPFTSGAPVALDTVSGLSVMITMTVLPSRIAARPFWYFAVRPSTPTFVYPQRYLEAPQPPDGPRQWLCDLAVAEFGDRFTPLAYCVPPFPQPGGARAPLCCGVTMGPAEVAAAGGLQAALDALAGTGVPNTLFLRPGIYVLAAPLTLTQKHEWLALEGCGDGVILRADPGQLAAFRQGMIQVQQVSGIALRRLVVEVPPVPVALAGVQVLVMNGVNASASPRLTIERCSFDNGQADKSLIVGGGVFASTDCTDLTVRGNRFVLSGNLSMARLLFGVLIGGGNSAVAVDDCDISDNLFVGLGLPFGVMGAIGLIRCQDNRVRQCANGFFFLAITSALAGQFAAQAVSPDTMSAMHEAARLPVSPAILAATGQVLRQAIMQAGARASGAATPLDAAGADEATRRAAPAASALTVDAILDAIDQQTETAELAGAPPRPALHVRDNDIELSTVASGSQGSAGLFIEMVGARLPCAALIHGNRIETPGPDVSAAQILIYRGQAVVTTNLFTQLPGQVANPAPALESAVFVGAFEVMGNVISPQATIAPTRTPPPTNDWNFLNTIG
jgi:hypothetical protein